MARKQTPDIMADLMQSSEQVSNKTIKSHNSKDCEQVETRSPLEGEQENHKTIKLPKNKAIKQDNDMEIILKEKATFNLSQSTLLKLEDAWIQLKRQLKGEQRITKTAIVEMALEICIKELTQKEAESTLYKGLAES